MVALGVFFDNLGSLCAPAPVLTAPLVIDVELKKEGLGITLVFDGQKSGLELIIEGQLLSSVSLSWWLSASSSA